LTTNIDIVEKCIEANDASECSGACQWRKGKIVAANTDVDRTNKAIFESNFCHPATVAGWDKEAPSCLTETTMLTCQAKQCVWSTAKELITDEGDFCVLSEISEDATAFKDCSEKDSTMCTGTCKWVIKGEYNTTPVAPVLPPVAGSCPWPNVDIPETFIKMTPPCNKFWDAKDCAWHCTAADPPADALTGSCIWKPSEGADIYDLKPI